jgi:uncharacterized protein YgbK (DUF1537 family)
MQPTASLLAFADDLTGALEVGAKFAKAGVTVVARFEPGCDLPSGAVVIDTETRHSRAEDATEQLSTLIHGSRLYDAAVIFKKTDSTLRGNIGPELRALADAYPGRAIVFSPAYPQMGRTVRLGHVFIDGQPLEATSFARDALNPVTSSYVPDLITSFGLHVITHENASCGADPGVVHVFDADTEDDVAAVTRFMDETTPAPVFCGTGSLAGHLSRKVGMLSEGPPRFRTPVRSAIVVNGSRHGISEQQLRYAEAMGWPTTTPEYALANGLPNEWTILRLELEGNQNARSVALGTGGLVRDVVQRLNCDTLVVFGGDTAFGVVEGLGEAMLRSIGELLPGIPVSIVGNLNFISKAGGFGPVDVLARIRQRIQEES